MSICNNLGVEKCKNKEYNLLYMLCVKRKGGLNGKRIKKAKT